MGRQDAFAIIALFMADHTCARAAEPLPVLSLSKGMTSPVSGNITACNQY